MYNLKHAIMKKIILTFAAVLAVSIASAQVDRTTNKQTDSRRTEANKVQQSQSPTKDVEIHAIKRTTKEPEIKALPTSPYATPTVEPAKTVMPVTPVHTNGTDNPVNGTNTTGKTGVPTSTTTTKP